MSDTPRVERIAYRDGYRYQLAESYAVDVRLYPAARIETTYITLDTDGVLTIRDGYAWDGATNAPDWDCAKRPSAVHDALYQLIGLGLLPRETRAHADRVFRDMCKEDGMSGWMSALWHTAVQKFGPKGGSAPKVVKHAP